MVAQWQGGEATMFQSKWIKSDSDLSPYFFNVDDALERDLRGKDRTSLANRRGSSLGYGRASWCLTGFELSCSIWYIKRISRVA